MINEAKVYREQGLYDQSHEIYLKALDHIENSPHLDNQDELARAVQREIQDVTEAINEVESADVRPALSEDVQHLIQRLFTFSDRPDVSTLEGALALARFGQYEKALDEYHVLLREGIQTVLTAKNILTCHLAFTSPDVALAQYEKWQICSMLPKMDLRVIRRFLKSVLQTKGIHASLPPVDDDYRKEAKPRPELLVFQSARIRVEDEGSGYRETVDLEVIFQSGNLINLLIPQQQKNLLKVFSVGAQLSNMQLYSPIAMLMTDGVVFGKTQITSGPRRGQVVLDVSVEIDWLLNEETTNESRPDSGEYQTEQMYFNEEFGGHYT
jgi:tetratricopeptide (TPR) repeat protein